MAGRVLGQRGSGLGALIFTLPIFVSSCALYFYARALARRGVLR